VPRHLGVYRHKELQAMARGRCRGKECAVHVEETRGWLAAVLVGADEDDLDTVLVAREALSVLNDVSPPLPPLSYPEEGVAATVGIGRALEALARAGWAADRVADAARLAHTARILTGHPAAGA
jgi:hypothetical protein